MQARYILNLPNKLTLTRVLIVPVLVVVLLTKLNDWLAVAIFLAAAITDFADGYLARSRKQITVLGKLMDPIADKLLIAGSLISLVEIGRAPAWLVVIIVGREFAVNGLRAVAASQKIVIPAGTLGKAKMIAQVIAVPLLILDVHVFGNNIGLLVLWATMLLTVWSGVNYFVEGLQRIDISL
ncbi:CDP-diacylglycerol--glycerol-3-phosphate 3-phosphatidyltransferase [candidate division KSB3 bacterium]|uniref:CDP-diacylglycerol--glycerol-3-phosphate 3-phosphatidyltransferase n=1 Tax=candidate division KSB3 bacterium TaxID=2044937 RepID=A0A9D5Q6A4_9BACT|nr:CDP-diacylglycerol--glycerol-3-phosphate 3-phosphatidyltransferase [candidate division KSB3 bacterium]MBD3325634.1 CDP-diacylglycerol--glycerol-3-phosphate 3-phosphatidyltransferase [candidate division KSB3 bacterium]